jgi:hypothetical protein
VGWDASVPPLTEWVAVLRVAERVEQLDGDAALLLRRVPEYGLLGQVDAHEGLAEHLDVRPGSWVSGVTARTRLEVERAVAVASGDASVRPLVVGEFRVRRLAD